MKIIPLHYQATSLNKEFSYEMLKRIALRRKTNTSIDNLDENYTCISRIKDPLWKAVCIEMADLMGPFCVQKIWESKLGSFCNSNKTIDLYCSTKDSSTFINQYSFLILECLRHYFPDIKNLKIKVKETQRFSGE
ncbi:MAG: hypothetical protein K2P93_05045 [Alphaproteobacteria bacterium]|nr:hypothetical protein [Alphaproteobacteria bacterium]